MTTPDEKKIAVILPGIGYTCDRPLLYYSGKLAQALGWDVMRVPYGGFPEKVRGDARKMKQSADLAFQQTAEALRDVQWARYGQILFIGKSVGTVVATAYAYAHGLACRHILFTPVEATFSYPAENAVAFHGTADPWAETPVLQRLCEKAGIPLWLTENANHSLETGDVALDIRNLALAMERAEQFMAAGPRPHAGDGSQTAAGGAGKTGG